MNATRARRMIRDMARAGKWEIVPHAIERMIERDATAEDIYEVLTNAVSCHADGARWRLGGVDSIGEDLTLIVEVSSEAIVVTLFRGDEP